MLTALVLQLIQCVTHLPDKLSAKKKKVHADDGESQAEQNNVSPYTSLKLLKDVIPSNCPLLFVILLLHIKYQSILTFSLKSKK